MLYQYTKQANLRSLTRQIEESGILGLDYMAQSGETLSIYFNNSLSTEDESTLGALVYAHDHGAPFLDAIVESRVDFGKRLIFEFTVRNQMSGKSDEDLFLMTDNLDIQKIVFGLSHGFLEYALFKVQSLELDGDRITQADKDWTIAKIGGYLGL